MYVCKTHRMATMSLAAFGGTASTIDSTALDFVVGAITVMMVTAAAYRVVPRIRYKGRHR